MTLVVSVGIVHAGIAIRRGGCHFHRITAIGISCWRGGIEHGNISLSIASNRKRAACRKIGDSVHGDGYCANVVGGGASSAGGDLAVQMMIIDILSIIVDRASSPFSKLSSYYIPLSRMLVC